MCFAKPRLLAQNREAYIIGSRADASLTSRAAIARARRCLEAPAIDDFYVAAPITDELATLQSTGRMGHCDAEHTEHGAEQLLRNAHLVRLQAVARGQEP